jgi:hypothetical protein
MREFGQQRQKGCEEAHGGMAPRTHHREWYHVPLEKGQALGLGIFDVVSSPLHASGGVAWGASRALNRRRPRHASRVARL